jgi:hypothetical protein
VLPRRRLCVNAGICSGAVGDGARGLGARIQLRRLGDGSRAVGGA